MAFRKYLAPEVVQTSYLDCGPASLKCVFDGFGIPLSYGRLREACQTGVDGTSIDTMETVAVQLGLDAEQVLLPLDHLFLPGARSLPCIIVVRLPTGLTHFVVLWRKQGSLLQLMDPATGRRWSAQSRFLKEVYTHSTAVPAEDWSEFAGSESFQSALRYRAHRLGIRRAAIDQLLQEGVKNWRFLAALDAAIRMADSLVRSGGLRSGRDSLHVIQRFSARPDLIPTRYWSAQPLAGASEDQVLVRGAVLVRFRGKKAAVEATELPAELAAAISERPPHPVRELLRFLHAGGMLTPPAVLLALALAAAGVVLEAVLFRSLFDLGRDLNLAGQRLAAMCAVILFSAALLFLEFPIFVSVLRLARQVENRLRIAFLAKIPRLSDRYFQSRLISDMAERSHTTQRLRHLPDVAQKLIRSSFELCATAAGMIWLDPAAAPLILLAVAAAIVPPFACQSMLAERDLRLRNHAAALTRYYLDAMLGLVAIRAHGAERALRRQHESLLEKWARAGFAFQRAILSVEGFQLITIFGLIAWILLTTLTQTADVGRVLLLVYWALNIPNLGQDIGALARQLPYYRNLTLRLLEPLGAPEELQSDPSDIAPVETAPRIQFRNVHVEAGGHSILREINLSIESGAQVAILGPSGAGKSSLVGVLLGWLRPSQGEVLIDGEPLNCESLRRRIAWVDPAVQLWNRSLFENLRYGSDRSALPLEGALNALSCATFWSTFPTVCRLFSVKVEGSFRVGRVNACAWPAPCCVLKPGSLF